MGMAGYLSGCVQKITLLLEDLFFVQIHHGRTWVSSDHITANRIDHVTISRKWCGSLDVGCKRGSAISSDH